MGRFSGGQRQGSSAEKDVVRESGAPGSLGAAIVVVQPDRTSASRLLGQSQVQVVLAVGGVTELVIGAEAPAGEGADPPRSDNRTHRPVAARGVLACESVQIFAVVVIPSAVAMLKRTVFLATKIVGLIDVPTPDGGRPASVALVELVQVDDIRPVCKSIEDVVVGDGSTRPCDSSDGGRIFPDPVHASEACKYHPIPVAIAAAAAVVPDDDVAPEVQHVLLGQVSGDGQITYEVLPII